MRRRVVLGTREVIATLSPTSAFTSVDLPTFGRPATATNPLLIPRTPRLPRPCPLAPTPWGTPAHHPVSAYRRNLSEWETASRQDRRRPSTAGSRRRVRSSAASAQETRSQPEL